ncbi:hypothetical protein [Marinoscillum furvescens]|uniref:Carbohydrate binding protein with CBM6 domain n=1 Tax=Marinoscillum furvescens DSM 4134 TaxID=1122208 RepID=A0A3D9L578_MARFU|nr:hypothetical protein [Marinoscillum furvescens]REE01183.1 hypothetical protein C7460_104203 [Marinoscillum furvescens DSM 4134]
MNYPTIFQYTLTVLGITLLSGLKLSAQSQDCYTIPAKAINTAVVSDYAPTYFDKGRQAIAVNSIKYPDQYAAVSFSFDQATGVYDIYLTSLLESDGESTYQILIDGKLVGEYQNPESTEDYKPFENVFKEVSLQKGATVSVACIAHTNGKVPEGSGTAYARGRWTSIRFCKN